MGRLLGLIYPPTVPASISTHIRKRLSPLPLEYAQQVRIVTLWRLKCLGRGTGFEFKFASLIRAALSSNEATLHSAPWPLCPRKRPN